MTYSIVIPAYNEQDFIALTLESLLAQTVKPKEIVVVNDNSTDGTAQLVAEFAARHDWIRLIDTTSHAVHLPGSKVIQAFQKGFELVDKDFDVIVKADADLIFPENYFETILEKFQSDEKIGMVGGFAYIEKDGEWILENLTDADHIRGAFKAYRKDCFGDIGGLRPAMGWDTVDELLCRFYGWKVVTVPELKVKHLKPTGANYDKKARYKQGEAFHSLGYGLLITAIASGKLAMRKKRPLLFLDYLFGFMRAKIRRRPLLVNSKQAAFIRRYRWEKIRAKLF